MASLQARHSRKCVQQGRWTAARVDACTCRPSPTYYAVHEHRGQLVRERLGRNRQDAERVLARIVVAKDEGGYTAPTNKTVSEWLDEWHASLRRPKASTRRDYRATIAYLREHLGTKRIRDVDVADAAGFLAFLEQRKRGKGKTARPITASTVAKHGRVASACFEAARRRGLTGRNPFRELDPAEKPRAVKRESGYFEDDELPRIAAELEDSLYRTAFLLGVKSGLRQGELIALRWGDVDTIGAVVRVRRTWTRHGGPVTEPKDHERRDVHVTPDVVELLGGWWGECGKPADNVLVFPADGGGYVSPWALLGRLRRAMNRAGVPLVHPRTRTARGWHSLRHSYARIALEGGCDVYWLQQQLGHSDLKTTIGTYGHLADAGRKAGAERVAGAFAAVA